MKCPDCRDEELDLITQSTVETVDGRIVEYDSSHYKCYKCRQEFDKEDIKETN